MINKKYFHSLFVALMALSMSLVLSFVAEVGREGFSDQFFTLWLKAAVLGFGFAFPTALIVTPIARWAAEQLTTNRGFK